MKCICGYEEPKEWEEEVEVLFKSGPRKGQLNKIETVVHEVEQKDRFIKIMVEKDFGFVREDRPMSYWQSAETWPVQLYACPKCSTVRMESVY